MKKSVIFTNLNFRSTATFLKEISKFPLLCRDEEKSLSLAARNGDQDALAKLVNSNLRIVVSICKKMAFGNVKWEDLLGAGGCGLVKAAQTYDSSRNVPFISYAEYWIRKEVLLEVDTLASMIHIPESQQRVLSKIKKAVAKFEQTHYLPPTVDDIAENIVLSVDKVKDAFTSCLSVSSYDVPLSDESDSSTFIETMSDPKQPMPDSSLSDESDQNHLVDILTPHFKCKDDAMLFYYWAVLKSPDKLLEFMDRKHINEKELVKRMMYIKDLLSHKENLKLFVKRIAC